jgi:hypothetical protein
MELDTELDELEPLSPAVRANYYEEFARGLRLYQHGQYHEALGFFVRVAQFWERHPEVVPAEWLRDTRYYLLKACVMTQMSKPKERQLSLPEGVFFLENVILRDENQLRRWSARVGIWFGRFGLRVFDRFERITVA